MSIIRTLEERLMTIRQALPGKTAGSLNRAVILLTTIARGSRKGSSLTELVARSGLPRPTIHRVLDSLIDLGWVERDAQTARYNLGQELAALGYSAICRHPLERLAATELSALAHALDQVVYLGVRSGLDMVCIGRYESQSQIQIGQGHVGLRGPFGMSLACMAIFAHLPQDEVQEIIRANMSRYHRIEGFDEAGFHRTVAEALKNGYGTYDNIILDRSTSGLAVAVLDPSGYPLAAIGTTFLSGWLDDEGKRQCLDKLRVAASSVARQLNVTAA
jgi:DNA-binding IclR family transcriptional regulator